MGSDALYPLVVSRPWLTSIPTCRGILRILRGVYQALLARDKDRLLMVVVQRLLPDVSVSINFIIALTAVAPLVPHFS